MPANRYFGTAPFAAMGRSYKNPTAHCSAYRDKAPAFCRRHIRFSQRQVIQPAPSR